MDICYRMVVGMVFTAGESLALNPLKRRSPVYAGIGAWRKTL